MTGLACDRRIGAWCSHASGPKRKPFARGSLGHQNRKGVLGQYTERIHIIRSMAQVTAERACAKSLYDMSDQDVRLLIHTAGCVLLQRQGKQAIIRTCSKSWYDMSPRSMAYCERPLVSAIIHQTAFRLLSVGFKTCFGWDPQHQRC